MEKQSPFMPTRAKREAAQDEEEVLTLRDLAEIARTIATLDRLHLILVYEIGASDSAALQNRATRAQLAELLDANSSVGERVWLTLRILAEDAHLALLPTVPRVMPPGGATQAHETV